jgi:ABC-type antimicrobial peptide transport system permease subunit
MLVASRDPAAAEQAVRQVMQARHPGMQIQFADFQQGILDHLVGDRMMARLAGFFGMLAALLVVVGLHGVLSYFLSQRRSEIGIRIALGASRGRVVASMLGNACVMLAAGLAIGAVLTVFASRGAGTLLFGLKPWDPPTLLAAAALLAVVTVVASLIPSLRAAHVNPIDSLRAE